MDDRFDAGLDQWDVTQVGAGRVIPTQNGLLLSIGRSSTSSLYSNAQIADYTYPPKNLRWRPPLRLTVTASASAPGANLIGTAGFGFWNHPFSPDLKRLPRLPRAVWFFFAAPPSDMQLAYGIPGYGWKASTIDATRVRTLALIPAALPLMLAMRIQAGYQRLWVPVQKTLGISESLLDGGLLAQTHTYVLEWLVNRITFWVDDAIVHQTDHASHGVMGFVAWIDNQFAVATPQGKLRFGIVPVEREQSLTLERVTIERL